MVFYTEWEFIGCLILTAAGLGHVFGQAFMFKGLGKVLTTFTTNYTDLSSKLPVDEISVYRPVSRRIWFFCVFALPMPVTTFLFYALHLYKEELTQIQGIILGSPKILTDWFTFAPPTSAGMIENII